MIAMKKAFFLIALWAFSCVAGAQESKNNSYYFDMAKSLDIFNTVYKQVNIQYVDTIDNNKMIVDAINHIFSQLDPYTVYYPKDKVGELKLMMTGKYGGIGATIGYNNQAKRVMISVPYENMPAAEAGLKKGDQILEIDDESMIDKDVSYVSNKLRGDAGTVFKLRIYRPSAKSNMTIKVKRRTIYQPPIPYYGMQKNGIGYINLTSFTDDCSKDVRRALLDLKRQGMKQLVLDLRGNGGGSEMEAVSIVNLFVGKGKKVVSNRGKTVQLNRDYLTTVEPVDSVMPLVVLVDENSASASEITAGALQDLDRAVIVGTRTFGKGLVQITQDVPYGGMLKVTSSKYYIPSGRCIQEATYKFGKGSVAANRQDSVRHTFYTIGGRPVKDGGGIEPDVEVKRDTMSNLAFYLMGMRDSNEVLLNYELDYIKKHPSIGEPSVFQLSEKDYKEFKERVIKSGFTYDPESKKLLKSLEAVVKMEGYYEDAKEDFERLKKKLEHNVSKDLDIHKESIMRMIENDLVMAYYYMRGAVEHALRDDKPMQEAVNILTDSDRYHQILHPQKTQ